MRDAEDLLNHVRDFFKKNLNYYISAINTEKGDSLLTSISEDEEHFIFMPTIRDITNKPIVLGFSFVKDIETDSIKNEILGRYNIACEAVFKDDFNYVVLNNAAHTIASRIAVWKAK